MGKRLFTVGLCALSVAALTAGTASARNVWGPPPAQIQLFDASGLARTIDCPSPTALSECGGNAASANLLEAEIHAPHGTPTDVIGAFRFLDPRGKMYLSGANNDASEAIMQALAVPVETDMAYFESLVAAAGDATAAKAHGHAAKKGHGKKGHAAKKGHGHSKSHK